MTRPAVLAAIAEFKDLRREAFLAKYKFGRARTYFIEFEGGTYDSKAIVGAAHGYLPGREPLRASDFSGGELTVANHLRSLGFDVPGNGASGDRPSGVDGNIADLVEQVARLRPAGARGRPVRHQALVLLWAIGRAHQGLPRLTRWVDVRDELRDLLARFGLPESRSTPEYAFVALAHTDWWEVPDAGAEVPRAHSGAVLRWLNAVNPSGGMPVEIYASLAENRAVRDAVVDAILVRFFPEETMVDLLATVGLDNHAADNRQHAVATTQIKRRPPLWTWAELVLACDLTARNSWHELDVSNPGVIELSELLRRLSTHPESRRPENFRSPDSVRFKMTNLAHCHPDSERKPSNRGPLDAEVVNAFLERPDEMHTLAEQIREHARDLQGDNGFAAAANTPTTARSPADAVQDALAQFKPKNDDAYTAAIKAQVQVRNRLHERLVADYGRAARTCGLTPATNVHPRDLTLTRKGHHWLVEVKIIYRGNATDAVRAVVGQLLQYRHFLYGPDGTVDLVAVFSENIGDAYVDFLETLGIRSIWRHGDAWKGSATAAREALFPPVSYRERPI